MDTVLDEFKLRENQPSDNLTHHQPSAEMYIHLLFNFKHELCISNLLLNNKLP